LNVKREKKKKKKKMAGRLLPRRRLSTESTTTRSYTPLVDADNNNGKDRSSGIPVGVAIVVALLFVGATFGGVFAVTYGNLLPRVAQNQRQIDAMVNGSSCSDQSLVVDAEECARNGSCIGQVDLTFDTLTATGNVQAGTFDLGSGSATCTAPMPDVPCFGDTLTLSYLAVSNSTVLGNGTSCLSPLLPSCYTIGGATCNGVALGQACLPQNLVVNVLNAVDIILTGSNASILVRSVQASSNITVQNLVSNETHFIDSVTCAAPMNNTCFDLAGYVCPMGSPLPDACLPDNLDFSTLSAQTQLNLNGAFTCQAGEPLDYATCIPGTSSNVPNTLVKLDGSGNFAAATITPTGPPYAGSVSGFTTSLTGDVTGTQSATVVSRIQGVTVTAASPTAGQVLAHSTTTGTWAPAASGFAVSNFAGDITGPLASNTIAKLRGVAVASAAPGPFNALRGTAGSTWAPATLTPTTYWKHFQLQGIPCNAADGPSYAGWEDILTCYDLNACACGDPYVCVLVTNHTAPVDGLYRFHVMMQINDASAGHGPEFHLNGAFYSYVSDYGPTPAGSGYTVDGTTYIQMNAGDYVSIWTPANITVVQIPSSGCGPNGRCQPVSNMDFMKYDIPF
jgi:hypothetical protein